MKGIFKKYIVISLKMKNIILRILIEDICSENTNNVLIMII